MFARERQGGQIVDLKRGDTFREKTFQLYYPQILFIFYI